MVDLHRYLSLSGGRYRKLTVYGKHPVRDARARKTPMNCYRCGEPGHARAECPDAPSSPEPHAHEDMPVIDTCFVCGKPGHYAVACKFHPARLRNLRGDACGPGPCTAACRIGDHNDCGFSWCTCPCHQMSL